MATYTKMTVRDWLDKYKPDSSKDHPIGGWYWSGIWYTADNPYFGGKYPGPYIMRKLGDIWGICCKACGSTMTYDYYTTIMVPDRLIKVRRRKGNQ